MLKIWAIGLVTSSLVALSACGGGGGDDSVSTPAATFDLRAAHSAMIMAGAQRAFTSATPACAGSANTLDAPAVAVTRGYSVRSRLSHDLACFGTMSEENAKIYNRVFSLVGSERPGSYLDLEVNAAPPLPAAVSVGDSGTYASLIEYSDVDKLARVGRRVITWTVESDNSTASVLVNLTERWFNLSNVVYRTEQKRYRLSSSGPLALWSIDIHNNVNGQRVLLTRN